MMSPRAGFPFLPQQNAHRRIPSAHRQFLRCFWCDEIENMRNGRVFVPSGRKMPRHQPFLLAKMEVRSAIWRVSPRKMGACGASESDLERAVFCLFWGVHVSVVIY